MDKHSVIKLHERGESFRSIEKILGINRKTIAKYCNEYDEEINKLNKNNEDIKEIQERIVSKPKYNTSNRKSRKYNNEIDKSLESILELEREKDKKLGRHKQSLTKQQMYDLIIDEGFDIGKSTIYKKINEKILKSKECFIRQEYDFGDRLEFDFGEVKLMLGGKKYKYYMAVFSSPAADFRWSYLYKTQNKEVFMDAHIRFFEMMGGVYKEVVYDNMRNVVTKFLGKNEKVLNEDLIKMSLYYGFDVNVTNAFSGNEKGHVEGSVKLIRQEIFAGKYIFRSEVDVKEYLNHKLIGMNENSKIEEEKELLLPYKPKLDLADIRVVTINKYSFARILNNSYSVPDYLVGKKINAKIYYDKIKFYSNNHFICEHKKIDGSNETSIDIRHYLKTFEKKPGAIRNSLALKSMPRLKTIYDIHFKAKQREFIELLNKYKDLEFLEIIEKFNEHVKGHNNKNKSSEISSITENQLNLYNNLLIKEVH